MNPGFVYFIRPVGQSGPVKIGHSMNPIFRLADIQRSSPLILELVAIHQGSKDDERAVQNCFADAHSHNEWFHGVQRLTSLIDDLKSGHALADVLDLSDVRGNVLGMISRATQERNSRAPKAERVA